MRPSLLDRLVALSTWMAPLQGGLDLVFAPVHRLRDRMDARWRG